MLYTVAVGTDANGRFTMLLYGDDVPAPGEHERIRVVGQTRDYAEALRMVQRENAAAPRATALSGGPGVAAPGTLRPATT